MSATIKVFYVGEKCFKHVMSSDHDCVELRDEADKTILTYSEDAKVFDHSGRLGHFNFDFLGGQPHWVYCEMPSETCITLGPDLPTAKVEISRRYINQSGLIAA